MSKYLPISEKIFSPGATRDLLEKCHANLVSLGVENVINTASSVLIAIRADDNSSKSLTMQVKGFAILYINPVGSELELGSPGGAPAMRLVNRFDGALFVSLAGGMVDD